MKTNENRGAGGIRRLDDGAALVDGVLDLGDVRIVLEALARQLFLRLLLRDLLLFGDPGVILVLKRPREARKGFAAEHVREEVAACEADVHLAVGKSDVERVAVGRAAHDGDLPVHGGFPLEKVFFERDVRDMIYCDSHFLAPSCFLCPVYTYSADKVTSSVFFTAFSPLS